MRALARESRLEPEYSSASWLAPMPVKRRRMVVRKVVRGGTKIRAGLRRRAPREV